MLVRLLVASFIPLLFVVSGVAIFFLALLAEGEQKTKRYRNPTEAGRNCCLEWLLGFMEYRITVIRHLEYQYAIDNIDEKKEIEIKDKVLNLYEKVIQYLCWFLHMTIAALFLILMSLYREVTRTRRYALGICVFSFIVNGHWYFC